MKSQYGTQNSVIVGAIDDHIAAPVAALTHPVLARAAVIASEAAASGVTALANLSSNLDRAKGGEGESPRPATFERGYALLDVPYRRWIRTLGDPNSVEEAQIDWNTIAHRVLTSAGDELIRDAGPAAWVGREVTSPGSDTPRLIDAGLADIWFRSALAKAFPRPRQDSASKELA